jgi:hypothetical protein
MHLVLRCMRWQFALLAWLSIEISATRMWCNHANIKRKMRYNQSRNICTVLLRINSCDRDPRSRGGGRVD